MKPARFSVLLAAFAMTASIPALAQGKPDAPKVTAGKILYSSDGKMIAPVYRVDSDGTLELIVEGRLMKIAGDTVSVENKKVTTSLTLSQVLSTR